MDLLWRVLSFFRADWTRVLGGLGLLLVHTLLSVAKPWPMALLVDRLAGGRIWLPLAAQGFSDGRYLALLVFGLLGFSLLHALVGALQQGLVISTGLRGLARVRRAVFEWLVGLPLRRLQAMQSGDLIYRATWDTYAFQTLFTHGLFVFLGATFHVIAMTMVMWRMNPALTGVAWATVPLLVLVMRWFGPRMSRRSESAQSADAQVATRVQQTVASLLLIQSYTREEIERRHFEGQAGSALSARWSQHQLEVIYLASVAAILALGMAGMIALGISRVEARVLSLGELLVFLAYLTQLYEPLSQLSHVGSTVSHARAGAQRVLELLEEPEVQQSSLAPSIAEPLPPSWGVELDRVCFGYSAERPVLKDLSLTVPPGEVLALIGPSGAGKTTLLQLIPRLLEVDSGQIRIGGRPLRSLDRTQLRQHVSLVLQEPLLLSATVAENIAYGRENATRTEIEAAARAAFADEFIRKMPQGYDTRVGEGATRLSVGEKQRVNLARAFLKDAPILLLDEPTSALDAESEAAVLQGLRGLIRGRTVLMVAHRLATLQEVHRVAVLNEGRIMEIGTPSELLAANGYFARMKGLQG